MITHLIAFASTLTPSDLLMGSNGALAVALVALYRDCKVDRAKLWAHVRDLEKRLGE